MFLRTVCKDPASRRLSCFLVQGMDLSDTAGRHNAIADDLRHGVRPGTYGFTKSVPESCRIFVFPDRIPAARIESDDDVIVILPISGVENPVLFGDPRIPVSERSLPDFPRWIG